MAQIGLGHSPQSRNTNLFTPSGRTNLVLVAFDLPSICLLPLVAQIGLGHNTTYTLHILIGREKAMEGD